MWIDGIDFFSIISKEFCKIWYFFENDKIIINEGPLIGLEGLITKIDRHKRIAYVNVELLGKLTRVQVGLEIISKS